MPLSSLNAHQCVNQLAHAEVERCSCINTHVEGTSTTIDAFPTPFDLVYAIYNSPTGTSTLIDDPQLTL
jgi:hypothetical protein